MTAPSCARNTITGSVAHRPGESDPEEREVAEDDADHDLAEDDRLAGALDEGAELRRDEDHRDPEEALRDAIGARSKRVGCDAECQRGAEGESGDSTALSGSSRRYWTWTALPARSARAALRRGRSTRSNASAASPSAAIANGSATQERERRIQAREPRP